MDDPRDLEARLAAVERAVAGDDATLSEFSDAATLASDVERLRGSVEDLTARVDELDAELQAVRGYVGGVRVVDESVERRVDLALATAREAADAGTDAEGLETERLVADDAGRTPATGSPVDASDADATAAAMAAPDVGDSAAVRATSDADEPSSSLAARLRDLL